MTIDDLAKVVDGYGRVARLYPAALTLVPVLLFIAIALPEMAFMSPTVRRRDDSLALETGISSTFAHRRDSFGNRSFLAQRGAS